MYRGTLDTACYCLPSCTGLSPSLAGFSKTVPLRYLRFLQSLPRDARIPVWALPISLAATFGITVVFSSSGYLDVSVHRVPLRTLCIGVRMTEVCSAGFPHSDIRGSRDMCSSPRLFAAYHVFLRLLVPRHPSCALLRFTFQAYPSSIALDSGSVVLCFGSYFFKFLDVLTLIFFRKFQIFRYSVFKVLSALTAEWRW